MKLEELLHGVEYRGDALPEDEITGITSDSRAVGPGDVFVCIAGARSDGHDFAAAAAAKGCVAVVAQHPTDASVPHILVEDTRLACSLMCGNFFGNPARRMKLIGVTGTNGKTTVSTLLKDILAHNGHKSGLIGTIRNMAGDEVIPARNTTPEPFELHQLFRRMADTGCEYCVMEVSSQALDQQRVAGLHFVAGIFTNLTQDHLDYHKTMENYMHAKQKLFTMCDAGLFNLDDSYAKDMIRAAKCRVVTYSTRNMDADYTARNIRLRPDGIDYEMVGLGLIGRVSSRIPGGFSVYNTLAAAACAVTVGLPLAGVTAALGRVPGVKGRIEVVPTGRDFTVILDYAHTPDALEKILKAIRGFARGRVVALFGCGGDRDRTKRPRMGAMAEKYADFLVVTSDNPRTEDPRKIIDDILPGLTGRVPHVVVENRRDAIEYAIRHAQKDDVILLAGKGHEDYQIIGTQKHHFDEREVVAQVLAGLKDQ